MVGLSVFSLLFSKRGGITTINTNEFFKRKRYKKKKVLHIGPTLLQQNWRRRWVKHEIQRICQFVSDSLIIVIWIYDSIPCKKTHATNVGLGMDDQCMTRTAASISILGPEHWVVVFLVWAFCFRFDG